MVPLTVVLTVVVFILVDLALRTALKTVERTRARKARLAALDTGLRLEYTDEARSLRRVEVEEPKARILAVDDEGVVLDSVRKILVVAGYSVDTVETGLEALGLIQKRDYDFVFVDLRMPDMNGIEVTKAVRHYRPDIDVIIVTGYASVESAVETMKYGAMDYFQKPFTEDELTAFVEKSLIRRQDRIERMTRPRVHLVTPSVGADGSRHSINVPSGVFISPTHVWISLQMNGSVRVGIDDFVQRFLGPIEAVELPAVGQRFERGDLLFSIKKGQRRAALPSPVSGTVGSVNWELANHIELLHMRPYELGWVCTIEPSTLPSELQSLRIGGDALAWYQRELDRYTATRTQLSSYAAKRETAEEEQSRLDDASWKAFEQLYLRI